LEKARGRKTTVNFGIDVQAFDPTAVPDHARAAKKFVLQSKKQDVLGVNKCGWDISNATGVKFPDKPMQRAISAYDSIKRADYNHRAEQLAWKETLRYLPKTNKFHVNQREVLSKGIADSAPTNKVPMQSNTEFPIHSDLQDKYGWQISVVTPTSKEREALISNQFDAAVRNRAKKPPSNYESLLDKHAKNVEAQRKLKLEHRTLSEQGIAVPSLRKVLMTIPDPPMAVTDAIEMEKQVPARKYTTWSLGSM